MGSLKDNLSTMDTRSWPDIHYLISMSHDIFVMFDDDDGVTEVDELSEIVDEETTITWVKSDRGFIEDVGDTFESSADLSRETDTLRFAA